MAEEKNNITSIKVVLFFKFLCFYLNLFLLMYALILKRRIGTSVLETVEDLRKCGVVCEDVICILDLEQNGAENLKKHSVTLHRYAILSHYFYS